MEAIGEIWDIYRTCWNETSSVQRAEKLQKILTDDFEYKDPNFEVKGYIQLSDYMKQFQEEFEGASFVTTDINIHHNRCLVNWNMINDNNEVLSNGTSFVLYENNKLKQITGFFKEN
ncbi:nuclear transport factor 2 family protein [Flavivirga aquimarina]|uniref:Nuclear transport factor 2 family protein n=1 Tax=Flavivirga aquimarina TaxID=2027862 RepID=A0ABT8W9F8_9FLAO|nr:nuclear transport factor 2 family protein [Flavivirga aquimarina]MDO5969770.1 nuclear transport factor 2 family protein [Flavivirga aquimarina]